MTYGRGSIQSMKNYTSERKGNDDTKNIITRNTNKFKIDKSIINNTKQSLSNSATISNIYFSILTLDIGT